jgi:putative Mg2+ transporter-C (MgtC) family protein
VAAVATTAIILVILVGLKPLEARFHASQRALKLQLRSATGAMSVGFLESVLGRRAARVKQMIVRPSEEPGWDNVVLVLNRVSTQDTAQIITALRASDAVAALQESAPT